jgi:hypothetical protein
MRALLRTHSGLAELAGVVALYAFYEVVRGFGTTSLETARAHTDWIVSVEQHAGVFIERAVQRGVAHFPALPLLLGVAYMTLHAVATVGMLVWVYRAHRERFAIVRTTLVATTSIALAIYVLYPAAPPRLAGLGFTDTVTKHAKVNLSSDALGALYNPFAAVPSLHFGYALLVGVAIFVLSTRRWVRIAAAAYPPLMLFIIVATGNHFLFDALAGGLVTVAGWLVARALLAPARARVRTAPVAATC